MLIEFRVANFRSFNKEQTLSMVASSGRDESLSENLIRGEKFDLLKSTAIYGANASGKSNLIKACYAMKWLIKFSATKMNQGDKIPNIIPFRLDTESRNKPSHFEIKFLIDETRYEYGFATSSEKIHEEWLNAYPLPYKKKQKWFERTYCKKTNKSNWNFRGPLKKEENILTDKTRENGLVLSRGAELNIKELSRVYTWIINNILIFDMSKSPDLLTSKTIERIKDDIVLQSRFNEMLKHADFGIEGFNVRETSLEIPSSDDLEQRIFELEEKKGLANDERVVLSAAKELLFAVKGAMHDSSVKQTSVEMAHKIYGSESKQNFEISEESNGTQRFFAILGPIIDAIDNGKIVVADELDCSMHPLLVRKLLELFQVNKSKAQLIFATHDSTLMDPELFRRDQIWITEKNPKGSTELYSLYDFDTKDRPRNTEKFQRNYLAGRYGGVPNFGPIFEDLEIK